MPLRIRTSNGLYSCIDVIEALKPNTKHASQIRARLQAQHAAKGFAPVPVRMPGSKRATPMGDRATIEVILKYVKKPAPGSVEAVRAVLGASATAEPATVTAADAITAEEQGDAPANASAEPVNATAEPADATEQDDMSHPPVQEMSHDAECEVSGVVTHSTLQNAMLPVVTSPEEFLQRVRTFNRHVAVPDILAAFSDNSNTNLSRWHRYQPEVSAELGVSIIHHRFPGNSRATPMVNMKGAISLAMRLPGKVAMEFRYRCFTVLEKHFAGEPTSGTKRKRTLQLALEEDKLVFDRAEQQITSVRRLSQAAGIDMSSLRELNAFQDWGRRVIDDVKNRTGNQLALGSGSAAAPVPAATAEISIPLVCQTMSIPYTSDVAKKASAIGRKMKQLYLGRHGNVEIPKRRVIHNNRPILENAYTDADADLMKQAISAVLGGSNGADA